jgi:hypothetical protein
MAATHPIHTPYTPPSGEAPIVTPATPGEPVRVMGTDYNLSDIARGTGMSLSHICRVFKGQRTPSIRAASAIAGYIGVSVDQLYAALGRIKAAA